MARLYLFILFGGFLIGCNSNNQKSSLNVQSLRKVVSFPTSKDTVLLVNPVNLTFTQDYIFISDQGASSIKMYDYEGNYVQNIGSKGRGPGEFMLQQRIALENDKLYINDQGNRMMSIYNIIDNTFEEFLIREQIFSFSVNNAILYAYIEYPFA